MTILTPPNPVVRCHAIVDLISKVQRPFLFLVTVFGEPPHAYQVKYHITAPDPNSAAAKGLEVFVASFTSPAIQLITGSAVPKAKLQ
jgi:hypothetical protein